MSKLNVTELESRIAPSVGLLSFLNQLAATNPTFASAWSQCYDPSTGTVDTSKATALFNSMGGSQAAPLLSVFPVSDSVQLSDKTAASILAALSKK